MESDGSEEALDITGESVSEGHISTESYLLNAYISPVVVRGQNENRASARRERGGLWTSQHCQLRGKKLQLFAHIEVYASFSRFFPFQFLTKTKESELS